MTNALSCLGSICAESGSWADWFAGAASVSAAMVALGGYGFAEWQRHRDHNEADVRTAQLIGMKAFRVLNSTHDIHRHLWAEYNGPALGLAGDPQIWRTIHPLIGVAFDLSLNLNGDETELLIRLREASYLTDLILAISRYQSIVSSMDEYRARYEAFHSMMPAPTEMEGQVGTYALTREEYMKLRPHSVTLEQLILSLCDMTAENVDQCERLGRAFHPMMKRHFKKERFIAIALPTETKSKGAT